MSKKDFIIGLDMDGVIYDFRKGVGSVAEIQEALGSLDLSGVELYNDKGSYNFWSEDWGLKENFVDENAYEVFDQGGISPSVRQIINGLYEKYNVVIITSPWAGLNHKKDPIPKYFHRSSKAKMDWLARMGIKYSSSFFTHNKALLDMNVLIDDGIHNHKNLVEKNHKAVHIYYDMNRDDKEEFFETVKGRQAFACTDWNDIKKTINKIYRERLSN